MPLLYAKTHFSAPKAEDLPRTFPKGRVCSRDGCGTILSQYNSHTACSLHEPRRRSEGLYLADRDWQHG